MQHWGSRDRTGWGQMESREEVGTGIEEVVTQASIKKKNIRWRRSPDTRRHFWFFVHLVAWLSEQGAQWQETSKIQACFLHTLHKSENWVETFLLMSSLKFSLMCNFYMMVFEIWNSWALRACMNQVPNFAFWNYSLQTCSVKQESANLSRHQIIWHVCLI
jgi:hypothetical protein